MDVKGRGRSMSSTSQIDEDMDLRRGPWTVDEDFTLINYIANHGEGRWNSLARCAGKYKYNHLYLLFIFTYYSNTIAKKNSPRSSKCFLFFFMNKPNNMLSICDSLV